MHRKLTDSAAAAEISEAPIKLLATLTPKILSTTSLPVKQGTA